MKYAIVESGGKQYRAVEGATLEVDRLPVEAGENIRLQQVLLLADGDNVVVGTPTIKDMTVWARALEHVKGPKVTVFNYRPKKRIRVKIGHRQSYTRLLIQQIGGAKLVEKAVEPEVEEPAEEEPKAAPKEKKPAAKKAAPAKETPKAKAEKKAAPKAAAEKKAAPKAAAKAAPKAAPKAKTSKPAPAAKKAPKSSEKKAE